jgi:c-di-GMP-binding flagellar brake protein YcgR
MSDYGALHEEPMLDQNNQRRRLNRYLVHWKIAVVFDSAVQGKERFYGKTDDMSLSGVSLYSEHNIFVETPVTVLISIPKSAPGARQSMVEVRCQMVYTYLCSKGLGFRTGLKFLRFKGEGKKTLKAALDQKIPAGSIKAVK